MDDIESDDETLEIGAPEPLECIREVLVVSAADRITSDIMSLFEFTEALSIRTAQIAKFNNPMVDPGGLRDPRQIAIRELMARKTPYVLRRPVGYRVVDGVTRELVEDWDPNTMIFPREYTNI
jgi:DNA-directed RNA polymerase subunit K/omega